MSATAGALLVLGGLAAALVLARRRAAAAPRAGLALEARVPLGKDAGVAVVRWRERELLVGYGPGGVSALASREEAAP
jgi:hypothetical protein